MSRVVVDVDGVDQFVSDQTEKGNNVSWDGWDLLFFSPNPNGFYDKNGAYQNNEWGVKARVVVGEDGLWRIPAKYVVSRRKRS